MVEPYISFFVETLGGRVDVYVSTIEGILATSTWPKWYLKTVCGLCRFPHSLLWGELRRPLGACSWYGPLRASVLVNFHVVIQGCNNVVSLTSLIQENTQGSRIQPGFLTFPSHNFIGKHHMGTGVLTWAFLQSSFHLFYLQSVTPWCFYIISIHPCQPQQSVLVLPCFRLSHLERGILTWGIASIRLACPSDWPVGSSVCYFLE